MKKYFRPLLAAVLVATFAAVPVVAGAVNIEYGLDDLKNEAGYGNKTLGEAVGAIVNVVLSVLGLVATVIIIIGGFIWMTSGGNPDQVGKAKKLMMAGVIGLIIILLAWSISHFLVTRITDIAS